MGMHLDLSTPGRLVGVLFLFVVLALASAQARAGFPPSTPPGACTVAPCNEWRYGVSFSQIWGSWAGPTGRQAACTEGVSVVAAAYPGDKKQFHSFNSSNGACYFTNNNGASGPFNLDMQARTISVSVPSCPANSTLISGSCECNSGFVQNGSSCEASQCAANAGQVKVINNTVAWFRSTDYDDWRNVGAATDPPYELCEAGCKWKSGADVKAWRSLEPTAQGLYRYSIDTQYVSQAETCSTASAAPNNPAAPNATCPGYVGEVNGKTVCAGTADKPIPGPSGAAVKPGAAPGNPSAGKAPDTGPGSGNGGNPRTPTVGGGGNAGGPAAAGVTTGSGQVGSGTVSSPGEGKEQAACGAPGQPKCGIDETGTPGASSIGDGIEGLGAADTARTGVLDAIKATGDKDGSWGVLPRWLTRSDCAPFDFGTFPVINVELSLNLCPYRSMYDAIASFVLVILTFATITVMVRETIVGG